MPDIRTLDILTINCNTIDTKEADMAGNHKTNMANCQESMGEHYVNMRQEADKTEKCYMNTHSISKFENKDKPTVTHNDKINYFFQTLTGIITKEWALKPHSKYKGSSKMYLMELDALMKHFHYRPNQIASHTRHSQNA